MNFKIICSLLIAIYYLIYAIVYNKTQTEKKKVKILSMSLLGTYIIYLVLIWIIV